MARLLLLEDDQSMIDGLVYALTKEGFALDVAMTVREARAQLAVQAYDLLLLDQRCQTAADWRCAKKCALVATLCRSFFSQRWMRRSR